MPEIEEEEKEEEEEDEILNVLILVYMQLTMGDQKCSKT